jgi:dTDP-4-dehydrorhamnose reductase
MKTRVLISGCNGQLLSDIVKAFRKHVHKYDIWPVGRDQMDVTNPYQCNHCFEKFKPHIYIHGASIHVVNEIEKNPNNALNVNVGSVHRLAKLCNKYNTLMVSFSTDYVFDGRLSVYEKANGYNEDSIPNPLNFYGVTKYSGEMTAKLSAERYLNVRVCSLFGEKGSQQKDGINFPYIVLKHIEDNEIMKVVNDQVITTGYTVDIANSLIKKLSDYVAPDDVRKMKISYEAKDTLHIMNEGILTWYEMANYIASLFGKQHLILPVCAKEIYEQTSDRPLFSALQNSKLSKLPRWESAITRFLIEIGKLKPENLNDS